MARREAEPAVEPQRIRPGLVGGQLHDAAAARLGESDGMDDHRLAETATAQRRCDAHGFDLRAPRAAMAEAGQKAQLQAADDAPSIAVNAAP